MRCIICGVGFCWLCLKPWNEHSGCNGYKENDVSAADQKRRTDFRKHLGRYIHYYERWDSNDKSRKSALVDLDRARDKHVETLALLQGASDDELKFVTKAWEQIVECRRVLKWTYAYGYYLSLKNISKKMNLFEFLQGQAETALERLHYCAEKEMDKYFLSRRDDFKDFRQKLGGLTEVTKNYFENLVRALENNLSEVDSKSSKNQKH